MTYRLQIPKHAPFAIGYTSEGKSHEYLPDVVGTLSNGKPFIAEAGMEDDIRGDRKRFAESGVLLVECPDSGRIWTLSPRGGVVRFKSHDKRTTTTSTPAERWVMRETIWNIVGGENT